MICVRSGLREISSVVVQDVRVRETWGASESHGACVSLEDSSEIPTSALLLLLYRALAKVVTRAAAAFLDACICMTLSPVGRRLLYVPDSSQNSPSVPACGVCATALIYKAQAGHTGFLLGVHALEFLEEAVGLFAGSLSPCQASVQG